MTHLDPADPRTDLALKLDPTILFTRMGMTPDTWQRDLLFDDSNWFLVCCGRQVGKTLAVAALALYTALTKPDALHVGQRRAHVPELGVDLHGAARLRDGG